MTPVRSRRPLPWVGLFLLTACVGADLGVAPCRFVPVNWMDALSDSVWNCGGAVPSPTIVRVSGPAEWVTAGGVWQGEVVLLEDRPSQGSLFLQPCVGPDEVLTEHVFIDDCDPRGPNVREEQPVVDGRVVVDVPELPAERVELCSDPVNWADPEFAVDPGPSMPWECATAFGFTARYRDNKDRVLSEFFVQLWDYPLFPSQAPDEVSLFPAETTATEQSDGFVRIISEIEIPKGVAEFLDGYDGRRFGGRAGIYPNRGRLVRPYRFDRMSRKDQTLTIDFVWDPAGAVTADLVVVANVATPVFGRDNSNMNEFVLHIERSDSQWSVSSRAMDTLVAP